ncbi:hypothetical protein [Nocardia sp. NPDC020380]|uniref:hypothetical protein n=1 Tax=Nocardia sp. NPDC020380 TaxID=3364309 RepID=UPI0037BC2F8F
MTFIVAAGVLESAVPMGMNKSGSQQIAGGAVDERVTNWVVRSGFGDTVINAKHELVSSGPGAVTVRCRLEVSGNLSFNETRSFTVMQNDTPAYTFTSIANSVVLPDKVLTLARGDRVWVRMTGSAVSLYPTAIAPGENTYLYFVPV